MFTTSSSNSAGFFIVDIASFCLKRESHFLSLSPEPNGTRQRYHRQYQVRLYALPVLRWQVRVRSHRAALYVHVWVAQTYRHLVIERTSDFLTLYIS